jgi:riboflavin synthase
VFTGLVQAKGVIARFERTAGGVALHVKPVAWGHRPALDESIAVNGVCLTVAGTGLALRFDVVQETLAKTTLGRLTAGDEVNLEHACRADSLLGGHVMQGHVDGVGRVLRAHADPADWRLDIEPPTDLMPYIVPKGAIAVEGVSLTIAAVGPRSFGVALIPTTLEKTTLARLRSGNEVNIETDILAKTVVHYLRNFAPLPYRAGV